MEFQPFATEARANLIARVDSFIQPHRAPWRQQMTSMPLQAMGRACTARLANLASQMGWTCALRREMFYGETVRFPFPACWDLLVYRSYIDEAELRLLKFMIGHLPRGAEVIDVGANIGFICQLASKIVGDKGRVHAFEPGRQALGFLRENLTGFDNTRIVQKAIIDHCGEVIFYEGRGSSMISSSTVENHISSRDSGDIKKVRVPAVTLDFYCDEQRLAPTLIKIDVEGAELSVLRGASDVLERHHPWIVLEVSFVRDEFAEHYEPCVKLLSEIGYEPYKFDDSGSPVPITPQGVSDHGADIGLDANFLHGLDNILFVHPERNLAQAV